MAQLFDFDAIRALCGYRNPMTATSPPESKLAEFEAEANAFMAGEEFDDMHKAAVEYVLDDPDLIEPILRAAVHYDIYTHQIVLAALKAAIDKARQDYIAFKTGE